MVSSTALIYLSFLVKACMMMHNYSSKGRLGDKTINTRTHHQNFPQHWFFFSPFSSSCPARLMTCMPAVSERGRPATVVQTRLSCGTSLPLHWPQCSLSCFGFPNSFLLQQVQGRSMKFWSQIMWKSQLIAFPLWKAPVLSVPTTTSPPPPPLLSFHSGADDFGPCQSKKLTRSPPAPSIHLSDLKRPLSTL